MRRTITATRGGPIWNALFSTGAGYEPDYTRDGMVRAPAQPTSFLDILPRRNAASATYAYMLQTTRTNAAAAVAEGAASPEATIVYSEQRADVEDVAVSLPVSLRVLNDVAGIETELNEELGNMVEEVLEAQTLTGDGTRPNLQGSVSALAAGQTHAFGTDGAGADTRIAAPFDDFDAAMLLVEENGFTSPDYAVMHPRFWHILQTRESSSGGFYTNPLNQTIRSVWGVPVVTSTRLSNATGATNYGALVGNFGRFARLAIRQDVDIEMGTNADDLTKRQRTIVAYVRAAMVLTRLSAFVRISNPAAGSAAGWGIKS